MLRRLRNWGCQTQRALPHDCAQFRRRKETHFQKSGCRSGNWTTETFARHGRYDRRSVGSRRKLLKPKEGLPKSPHQDLENNVSGRRRKLLRQHLEGIQSFFGCVEWKSWTHRRRQALWWVDKETLAIPHCISPCRTKNSSAWRIGSSKAAKTRCH